MTAASWSTPSTCRSSRASAGDDPPPDRIRRLGLRRLGPAAEPAHRPGRARGGARARHAPRVEPDRRRPNRRGGARPRAGGEPRRPAGARECAQRRPAARRARARERAGGRRLRRAPRRPQSHLPLPPPHARGGEPLRACPGPPLAASHRPRRARPLRRRDRRRPRLHRLHPDADRPRALHAQGAARQVARPRTRRARALDRGRDVHAAHGAHARRDDARGGRGTPLRAGLPHAPRRASARPSRRYGCGPRAVPRIGSLPMRVLLTNDDGIQATGLNELRRALLEVPGVELAVVAPNANRSATARSITTRRPLEVEEIEFGDGTTGFAADGTPVDCVRLAALGLVSGPPELIVSGINHGSNLGDDITYSGTVAAALEGVVLGVPGIAVSQQSKAREMDFRLGHEFDFGEAAAFTARLVEELESLPLPEGTLLNINCPAGDVAGARATRLGRRIYRDKLELHDEQDGRRAYRIYGDDPSYHQEPGTDFAAIADGQIAVTPLHFDLTATDVVEELGGFDLDRLIRPAAEQVE